MPAVHAFAHQPATPADPPRVFITDSNSWEVGGNSIGGAGAVGAAFGAGSLSHSGGGARPQTAEVVKTFNQRCPQVMVNNRPNLSDYIVHLDHEGGKGLLSHKDKIAVFVQTSGDAIYSKSTLSLGGSVQDACTAILAHWTAHATDLKAAARAAAAPPAPSAPIVLQAIPTAPPGIHVDASVSNCDIQIDGDFVGNTPSTVTLTPGRHTIIVRKSGFKDWTRSITFSGGEVRLSADMAAN
jgi:hypothetical protein